MTPGSFDPKDLTIIGCKAIGHDQAFCLLRNGRIEFFAEEERFNRVKKSWNCTLGALRALQAQCGIAADTPVVLNHYDDLEWFALDAHAYASAQAAGTKRFLGMDGARVKAEIMCSQHYVRSGLGFSYVTIPPCPDHHLLHAASAFFPSPFERAAILTVDGAGDATSTLIARGVGNAIEPLYRVPLPHSVGHVYSLTTIWLGLGGFGDEGKTMGAAPYGDPLRYYDRFRAQLIDFDDDGMFVVKTPDIVATLDALCGPDVIDVPKTTMTQAKFDVAAAVQKLTEDILLCLVKTAVRLTGERRVVMAGGVALNSVANGKILASGLVDDLWVQPIASDAGLAIGGALWNWYVTYGQPRALAADGRPGWWTQDHMYWGTTSTDAEIEAALQEFNLPIRKVADPSAWAAERLADNQIVGWFQGAMESGPRALGNRSILANPLHPEMRDIVNAKVKFREPWRPFAPSVLAEACATYFDSAHASPYMILVYNVREEWQAKLPSITHVDGTARVQTVEAHINPKYYALIHAFGERTGVPMVLNTSFNLAGEPIVRTPRQAIIDFLRCGMDALVLHDYVLTVDDKARARTTRIKPQFGPPEDQLAQLPAGNYLVFDFLSAAPAAEKFRDAIVYYAEQYRQRWWVVPSLEEQPPAVFTALQQRWPQVVAECTMERAVRAANTQLPVGILLLFPIEVCMLACQHCVSDVAYVRSALQNICKQFPAVPLWCLGINGVLTRDSEFLALTSHLEADVAAIVDREATADIEKSPLAPFLADLRRRFPEWA